MKTRIVVEGDDGEKRFEAVYPGAVLCHKGTAAYVRGMVDAPEREGVKYLVIEMREQEWLRREQFVGGGKGCDQVPGSATKTPGG